ncbi:MAG: trigger factor [Alphaproteobacteria bacterium]|nr:trigger factor [Alphaproteobacteria bacterium]
MTKNNEKNNGLQKVFNATISNKDFETKVDAALERLAKTTKIAGFRPGKAPKAMISQKYRASVMGEVLDEAVNETVNKLVADNKLRLAMQPKVEIKKFNEGKDIELEITTELLPEIEIGDFSKIELQRLTSDVPEEEVEKALGYIAHSRRETTKVEDTTYKAQKGDSVIIDFVGSVDGKEFEGGKGESYPLELGSNTFIPGFEDQLINAKIGDKIDVKVKFPENYHAKNLAGKDSVFAVTVKAIRQPKKIEIDDEFAKSVGEKDLAALKDKIRTRIAEDYASASKVQLKRQLLDKLDEQYSFEVPESMVNAEFANIEKQYKRAKELNQLDEHEKNTPEKDLMDEYKKIATRRVKLGLLLAEVGEQAKIKVLPEDMNAAIQNEAKRYPGQEKAVLDYYLKNPKALEALRAPVMEEKLIDHVLSKVAISDKKVKVEELYKED